MEQQYFRPTENTLTGIELCLEVLFVLVGTVGSYGNTSTKMHAKATVNGKVVAETDNYEMVDGNVYVGLPRA